jgi:hypothetical protein
MRGGGEEGFAGLRLGVVKLAADRTRSSALYPLLAPSFVVRYHHVSVSRRCKIGKRGIHISHRYRTRF